MKEFVLELTKSGLKVSKSNGLLQFQVGSEKSELPIDDVSGVLILGPNISITTNVIGGLLERNVPIVFSDDKYLPIATLLSDRGHHQLQIRRKAQSELSEAQTNRFWQKIIQKKLLMQATVLDLAHKDSQLIKKFISEVETGDSLNHEAQAARIYWKLLFGDNFIRDRQGSGINTFLNYGYAILRNSVARSVAASGLNPNAGIFHSNQSNPFCLIDDLMEPFRPVLDLVVYKNFEHWEDDLTPAVKRALVEVLQVEIVSQNQKKPLQSFIHEFVFNYVTAVSKADYRELDMSWKLGL